MKNLMLVALVALVLAFVAIPANAQNGAFAPYVDGSISLSGGGGVLTTSNPGYQVGGGIESSTSHLLLDVNGQFNSANVHIFNSGYTGTVTGSAYFKLGALLLGGGGYWSNTVAAGTNPLTVFSSLSANYLQARPFIGGVIQTTRDRLLVGYVLPGLDQIQASGNVFSNVNSRTVNVSNEYILGKTGLGHHLRFTQNLSFTSANTAASVSTSPTRTTSYSGGVGLKFVL
jgi:hypothetical protein